jgi:membrane protein YqaA with SNARE-associated domain
LKSSHLLFVLSFSGWILRFFRRLGVFGLLLLSALDSSFLVLPFGNDLLLIALVSHNRDSVIWIAYVLVSAIGSVIGVLIVDLLMRPAGERGLEHFISQQQIEKLKAKLENKAGITVFFATLIPPPFPFTPAVMTASALQTPRGKLLSAVFFGRLLRFGAEAVLALYFGRQVIAFINSDVVSYIVYGIIGIGVVLSTLSVLKWLRRNP